MLEMIAYKATNGQFVCREPQSDFFIGANGLADTDLYLTSVDESQYIQTAGDISVRYCNSVHVRFDVNTAKWVEVTPKRTLIVHYERVITQTSSYQVSADNEEEAVKLAPPLNGGVTWTEVSSLTDIKHVEVVPIGTLVSPELSEGMMGERIVKEPGYCVYYWDQSSSTLHIQGPYKEFPQYIGLDKNVKHCKAIVIHPDLEHLIKLEV